MGTSNAFGGASGGTPLVPSWLEDTGSGGGAPSDPPTDGSGDDAPAESNDPGTPPPAPPERPTPPAPGETDRYTSARTNFTRYARSGGDDRRSMGRAVSQYVSRSSGGATQAARRMGSSRGAASRLAGVLGRVGNEGAVLGEVLRSLDLGGLAGRPIEEVFAGLADFICPEGGSIDEGIARDAFIETIADLADAGITDIDGMAGRPIEEVFAGLADLSIDEGIARAGHRYRRIDSRSDADGVRTLHRTHDRSTHMQRYWSPGREHAVGCPNRRAH